MEWPIVRGLYMPPAVPDEAYRFWVEAMARLKADPRFVEERVKAGLFAFPSTGDAFTALAIQRVSEMRLLVREISLLQ